MRHRRIFDLLCHTERAEQTALRIAQPRHLVLNDDTAALLKNRALSSLQRVEPHIPADNWPRGLRALIGKRQKKAAASSPTVIAPMTMPFDGSMTATET